MCKAERKVRLAKTEIVKLYSFLEACKKSKELNKLFGDLGSYMDSLKKAFIGLSVYPLEEDFKELVVNRPSKLNPDKHEYEDIIKRLYNISGSLIRKTKGFPKHQKFLPEMKSLAEERAKYLFELAAGEINRLDLDHILKDNQL